MTDIDVVAEVNANRRETRKRTIPAGEGRSVVLRRTYDAAIEDVWDACTDPERLSRWFGKVTGDFRHGGTYDIEGNAHGDITHCEPPRAFTLTWVFGEFPASLLELRLSAADGRTTLELEHAIGTDLAEALLGVAGGWDGALVALAEHLRGGHLDENEFAASPQGREYVTLSTNAWGTALKAAGYPADEITQLVEKTVSFYTLDPGSTPEQGNGQ